jgi:hypothetical protein
VPEWRVGDTWQYKVTTQSATGTTYGNLTIKVASDGEVRIGNATVRAYTLSGILTPWAPVNATNSRLREQVRWGPIYTIVRTTEIVEKRTLCTLRSEINISAVHYSDVTNDTELLVYSPSDGRLRFPLAPGSGWNITFNQTRTHRYPFKVITENNTLTRRYECESYESVTYKEKGYRIRCTTDGSGAETVFWFSPHYRADVRREESGSPPGTVRTYTLVRFGSAEEPSIFSSPQTVLALIFGITAAAMLAVAVMVRFLPGPLASYRARYGEKHPEPETEAAKRPPAPRGRPPAGPGPAPRSGPGRSL